MAERQGNSQARPALCLARFSLSCPTRSSMSTPSPSDPATARSVGASGDAATGGAGPGAASAGPDGDAVDTASLIDQLDQDRLWLLRQIDSGRWAEWRLDLAALERELGQLLEQARDRGAS